MLEDALFRIGGERERYPLTVAGRTDRGVHATAQVASHAGAALSARALNAILPEDLSVLASKPAAEGFDARRDATSRSYRYRVHTRPEHDPFEHLRALHHPHTLDDDALTEAASLLVGVHDFTAFTPTETDHVRFERDIHAAGWARESEHVLAFTITADAFMRNMIRILVGTMLEVAGGRRDFGDLERLLTGRPRPEAGPTAPPHGLYFIAAHYGRPAG